MSSFDMQYDEDDDVLEVTFADYDEQFAHTLALNDHIFVFTDIGLGTVWGITFYSFSRLLGVSETEFTALKDLPDEKVDACLALLSAPPASHFFDLTIPHALIARIRTPTVEAMVIGRAIERGIVESDSENIE
jgi:hypothetical protein